MKVSAMHKCRTSRTHGLVVACSMVESVRDDNQPKLTALTSHSCSIRCYLSQLYYDQ